MAPAGQPPLPAFALAAQCRPCLPSAAPETTDAGRGCLPHERREAVGEALSLQCGGGGAGGKTGARTGAAANEADGPLDVAASPHK